MQEIKNVEHYFSDGLYCKMMIIADGSEVVSHKHNYDHLSVLAKGCAIVEVDDEQYTFYAPSIINIKKGKRHSVRPVNGDAVWLCIHATDETDADKIDEVLIQHA